MIPNFEVRGVLAGWDAHQTKAHPRLPNTSQYNVLLYLPTFGRNSNIKLDPPIRPLIWGVRVDIGGRKWYQLTSHPHIPIRLINTLGLYCTVWPPYIMRDAANRQTDRARAMAIGRLRYIIGGLKAVYRFVFG